MPTVDDLFSEAIQEAYASAPTGTIILYTLELRHPAFLNENNVVTPIRIVSDQGIFLHDGDPEIWGHILKIEEGAPVNGGEDVEFVSMMFDFTLPDQQAGNLPTVDIKIDNITRETSRYLDAAVNFDEPIEVSYREYLLSEDDNSPQYILEGLSIQKVKSTIFNVTVTASFADLINRNFPGKVYRPEEFRGLIG